MFSSSPTASQENLKIPPTKRRGTIFQNEHPNIEKVIYTYYNIKIIYYN